MKSQQPDLVEVFETALARAEAEGFVAAQDKERLERTFHEVVAELEEYRKQMRLVAGGRKEQARQELKQASRFLSRESVKQIRAKMERPEAVAAQRQAPMFYGLTPAEAVAGRLVKEPSQLGRTGPEKKAAAPQDRGVRPPGAGLSRAPGLFGFGLKNGMKPGALMGSAPSSKPGPSSS